MGLPSDSQESVLWAEVREGGRGQVETGPCFRWLLREASEWNGCFNDLEGQKCKAWGYKY